MLPELTQFEETVTLVNDSGIQFMDFALTLDLRKEPSGLFAKMGNALIARLLQNKETGEYFHLGPISTEGKSGESLDKAQQQERLISETDEDLRVSMQSSLELLNGLWLPVPFFRFMHPERYDEGPSNWARMRMVQLDEPDIDGHTHRLTVAFDTRVMRVSNGMQYLAPTREDVNAGAFFRLACNAKQTRWFMDHKWVQEWLKEIYLEANKHRTEESNNEDIAEQKHIAHYLNLLSLLAKPIPEQRNSEPAKVDIPQIKLGANGVDSIDPPITVDLVLDVGNSRTCGILIENHGQAGDGMSANYALQLRDLSRPEQVYSHPFESRIEFTQAAFGKENFSGQSGRHDAFQWPTIARVGSEAARLAGQRRGTEGSTGLSSPKRYLWDEEGYTHGWRFNCSHLKTSQEPKATAAPFSHKITKLGQAFYKLKNEDDRLPAFSPQYSRSSLMTFMLAEVLTQALSQINSPAQRTRQGHTDRPRQLSSITLTVPPGMTQAERSILNDRMLQAIALVWKCMGWHEGDLDPSKSNKSNSGVPLPRIPLPKIKVEWDEASCGQLVYLYTEVRENFAGHPEEFFDSLARPDKKDRERITLASIDIGGGTTDLVITDYRIERGAENSAGSNVSIIPEQRFRDSFKVAGDDILLDIIQRFVLPSFTRALRGVGVKAPDSLLSKLSGKETVTAQEAVLRQQLNLQVFTPLGLALLKAYEQFNPEQPSDISTHTYAELLGADAVSEGVRNYVASAVRRADGGTTDFNLQQVEIQLDLSAIHAAFLNDQINLTKILDALCEVIFQYPCDALLLTGRPSRLAGVQAHIRKNLPLPPGRIIPMQGYRTGGWYPFHKNGQIDDPKSTAAVGAMLCLLSEQRNISNFYFGVSRLKPYSTMRHIGTLDTNNLITDSDVLYRDVTTDNGRLVLHDDAIDGPQLPVQGRLRLGYRQLCAERWVASPLYLIQLTDKGKAKLSGKKTSDGLNPYLLLRFKVKAADAERSDAEIISDLLEIDDNIESNIEGGDTFDPKKDVKLQLYTMSSADDGASDYWLDSGNVNPK
jgi:hypothetical protein